MNELPIEYRQFISSCENPILKSYFIKLKNDLKGDRMQIYEPCGKCVPCERIIRDQLSYNSHYEKMINDAREVNRKSNRLIYLEKNHPEIYENIDKVVLKLTKYGDKITIRNILRSTGLIYVKTKLINDIKLINEIIDVKKENFLPQLLF